MNTTARTMRTAAPLASSLALGLALAACGGGEGGGTRYDTSSGADASGTPAAALPTSPYAADAWTPEPPATTTRAVVVSPDFDFASGREIPLVIDVPEARGTTSYLSVCLEWTDDGSGVPDVDYDSCVLRATLEDGYLSAGIAVANAHRSALAVLWFEDPARAPVHRELDLGGA